MNYTSFLIEALNELIKINKDRVVGYLQAAKEMDKTDGFLKDTCLQIAQDGKQNIQDLSDEIKKLNAGSVQANNKSGKVIKLWNEVIEADSISDSKPSFASSVCSEDAVQKAYDDTLLTYTFMPLELQTIIARQKRKIGYFKKEIMKYLNTNKLVAVA